MSNVNEMNKNSTLLEDYIFYNGEITLDRFNYSEERDYILAKLMLSLISGSTSFDYEELLIYLPHKLQEIVRYRWEAITSIFNGEYDTAEPLLLLALEKVKENRIEKWIKRDILLDLRNLETIKYNRQGKVVFETPHQKDLKAMDKWNYRPSIDWILENSLFDVVKENFSISTDGPHTVRFGGNFSTAIDKITIAFHTTIMMGSFTFIHIIRERLAYILFNYGKLYNDSRLLFHSLKLFMIENNVTAIKKILNSEWNNLVKEFIDTPTMLLNSSFLEGEKSESIVMKCILIQKLGPYFYDEELSEISAFLYACLDKPFSFSTNIDIKRNAIIAYTDIINRINNSEILDKLIEIFDMENDLVKDEIYKLMTNINWSNVSKDISGQLLLNIYRKRKGVLRGENVYSILFSIKQSQPDILNEIEEEIIKEWKVNQSIDINLYFSTHKIIEPLFNDFINDILNKIESDNSKMLKGSAISVGGISLYHLWANHTINSSLLKSEALDLYKKVLVNPYQTSTNKHDCVESIIRVAESNEGEFLLLLKMQLGPFFKTNLQKILVSRKDNLFGPHSDDERLMLKLFELLVILEVPAFSPDEILSKCIEYGSHTNVDVREGTISLIHAITNKFSDSYEQFTMQYLYSKTYDTWYKVRGDAIYLLGSMPEVNKEWESIIQRRMFELIDDSNSYVRSSIIASIGERNKKDKYLKKEFKNMIAILKRDRHYKLRNQVSNILKE
jgi:hypothetical protein